MTTKQNYFRLGAATEKLHRLFLETISRELSRLQIRDINSVQCLILYHVGHEKQKPTIGELTKRGYYLGENVSYNLKKMVHNGYFVQLENDEDKRSSYIKLSEKGVKIYEILDQLFKDHSYDLEQCGISNNDLNKLNKMLNSIEKFLETIKSG